MHHFTHTHICKDIPLFLIYPNDFKQSYKEIYLNWIAKIFILKKQFKKRLTREHISVVLFFPQYFLFLSAGISSAETTHPFYDQALNISQHCLCLRTLQFLKRKYFKPGEYIYLRSSGTTYHPSMYGRREVVFQEKAIL